MAGSIVTKWYSPKGKPNDRLRITVFVKARALRSDSIVVTVERQARSPDGQWDETTIAAMSRIISKTIFSNRRGKSIARRRRHR